jgi:Family of unknown function (DUF6221)
MDLTRFLNGRLAEDEVSATPGRHALDDLRFDLKLGDSYEQRLSSRIEDGLDIQTGAWQARVLREVEAKRKILAEHAEDEQSGRCIRCGDWQSEDEGTMPWPCLTVRAVVAVWSDRPDFDEGWRP